MFGFSFFTGDFDMTEPTNGQDSVALGTWIGREQAFNALAHHCSKARVACLKQIHDTEAYKNLNLTWEEFCPEHAGISRTHADRLISQFAEFGAPYFELTDIVPVSPAVYRQIEPVIAGGTIEFRGEQIPIIPENAVKIRAAIYALRKELECVKSEALTPTPPDLTSLQVRFDAYCDDFGRLIGQSGQEQKPGLRPLVTYSIEKLNDLARRL
jgi:hypothetical protein